MESPPRRHDGFSGQHLVVVPKSVLDNAARHSLLRGLLVTDAGYFPDALGHHMEREKGSHTHLVIACLRGYGWVREATGERRVQAGDLVWLRARQAHAYGADETEPWTIGWVHFMGDEAEAWRNHLGFGGTGPSILNRISLESLAALKFEQIYLTLEHGYSTPELIDAALMLRSAFALAAHAVRAGNSNRTPADRIAIVREHLRTNLAQPHRLEELAVAAGLSVPHFSALFRKQTGYSPIDFLIRQRVHRACRLLDTTDASISAIAGEVGYEDPYYFARCFRRIVGTSPSEYRRTPKG